MRARLLETYLSLDRRSLGLFRIAYGLLLLVDLLRRVPDLAIWYSNEGLLPNHTSLWRPMEPDVFSLLFTASSPAEAAVCFVLMAVVFVLFTIGYRTSVMKVLTFVCLTSMHSRVIPLENGGDVVMSLWGFWTLFLPLGDRFSVDALLRARAASPSDEPRPAPGVVSLACFALLFEICVIYAFNGLHKNGPEWLSGQAIHYLLYQDRIVTGIGTMLQGRLPLWVDNVMTWGTLVVEIGGPILLLSPFQRTWCRRIAIPSLIGLHLGIALLVHVGLFSATMIVGLLLFLTADDWDLAARVVRGSSCLSSWRARAMAVAQSATVFLAAPGTGVPASSRAIFVRKVASNVVMAACLYAVVAQASRQNWIVPKSMHLPQPAWAVHLVGYARLYQGWSMFAPTPPKSEMSLVVDAVTVDGRHVDPLAHAARGHADVVLDRLPVGQPLDQFWTSFSLRIRGRGQFHDPFRDWILAYHERTGRPEDRITAFRVVELWRATPNRGQPVTNELRTTVWMTHPESPQR